MFKLLLLLIIFNSLSALGQVVGNPDGDIVETYVEPNSSYEPSLATSDFELDKSPLTSYGYPSNYENLASTSNRSFGKRCNYFMHEMYDLSVLFGAAFDSIFSNLNLSSLNRCDSGYSCIKLNKLNRLLAFRSTTSATATSSSGSVAGNYIEFQDRAGKICLKRKDCQSALHLSPKQKCLNDGGSNCSSKEEKCFYTDLCKTIPPSKLEIDMGLSEDNIVKCSNDYQCSSGYCIELTDMQKTFLLGDNAPSFNKICAPAAECRPECTPQGEYLPNVNENYCCSDSVPLTENNGEIFCASPAELFPFGPPMFEIDWKEENCAGYIYEKTNFSSSLESDDTINYPADYNDWDSYQKAIFTDAKNKKYYRSLRALEFLWTHNQMPGSGDKKYDYYKLYKYANALGQRIQEGHKDADAEYLRAIRTLEKSKIEMEDDLTEGGNTISSEASAGISNIEALMNYHRDLASFYGKQSDDYYRILGFKYDEMDYSGSNDFASMQDSYDKMRLGSYSSSWPSNHFSRDSLAGMFFQIRQPKSTGIISRYDEYDNSTSPFTGINPFDNTPFRRNLNCKNQRGEWIKADNSDVGIGNGGDKKDNSVCVKELSRITGFTDNKYVELVDPIHPQGLMGNEISNSEYSLHPTEFPPAKRFRINVNTLKENIKNQYIDYANESWILPGTDGCVTQKRSIDRISNAELAMMVSYSANPQFQSLVGLELEEMIERAEDILAGEGNISWRENIAHEFTQDYIYQALLGVYQQDFVRDTIDAGPIFGPVALAIIVVGIAILVIGATVLSGGALGAALIVAGASATIGSVASLVVIGTQTYDFANMSSQFINQLYDYEFSPLYITTNERRPWNCTGSNCYDRRYLNSISYKSEIHSVGIEPYLNMALYLESYARARELYHTKVKLCLEDKKIDYENSYDVTGNRNYKIDFGDEAESPDIDIVEMATEECDPDSVYGHRGAYQGGTGVDPLDSPSDTINTGEIKNKEKLGENVGGEEVSIGVNLGLGAKPNMAGEITDSEPSIEDKKNDIKELEKALKKRNSAVAKNKRRRLERLKNFGLKKAPNTGFENAIIANQLAKQLKRSKSGSKFLAALSKAVSTSSIKDSKLKSDDKLPEKIGDKKENANASVDTSDQRQRNYYGERGNYDTDDENIDDLMMKEAKKVKKSDRDSLWETITKTYLKIGIPRLFDTKKKK